MLLIQNFSLPLTQTWSREGKLCPYLHCFSLSFSIPPSLLSLCLWLLRDWSGRRQKRWGTERIFSSELVALSSITDTSVHACIYHCMALLWVLQRSPLCGPTAVRNPPQCLMVSPPSLSISLLCIPPPFCCPYHLTCVGNSKDDSSLPIFTGSLLDPQKHPCPSMILFTCSTIKMIPEASHPQTSLGKRHDPLPVSLKLLGLTGVLPPLFLVLGNSSANFGSSVHTFWS